MRNIIDHWCLVGTGQSQQLGPPFSGKGKPTLSPRVGIFLPPLNAIDRIYLSHKPRINHDNDKLEGIEAPDRSPESWLILISG